MMSSDSGKMRRSMKQVWCRESLGSTRRRGDEFGGFYISSIEILPYLLTGLSRFTILNAKIFCIPWKKVIGRPG